MKNVNILKNNKRNTLYIDYKKFNYKYLFIYLRHLNKFILILQREMNGIHLKDYNFVLNGIICKICVFV